MIKLVINGRLPSYNEYINACRSHWSKGAKLKKDLEEFIQFELISSRFLKILNPVTIKYTWYEKNRKRDLDNIMSGQKFIQDTLVKMGILQNDGWKNIIGISHDFKVDKENPRIEIYIEEVK